MVPNVNIVVGKVNEYFGVLELLFLDKVIFGEESLLSYPKLKNILQKSKNKKVDLKCFFEKFEKDNKKKLSKVAKDIEKAWDPLNNQIMKTFEEIHEIKWTKKYSQFRVRIVLTPVNSRYLGYNAFDVFYRDNKKEMVDTFLHEISHFIFFEKIKKIYPKINSKEFDHPHLIWKMSEMMPGIILQDKRVQSIFKNKKLSVYPNIKKMKINGKLILNILQVFYNERKDFTDFVKKSYNFIKTHKKEINEQF